MLKKIAGLALLVVSISFLSSFISSLDFSKTGFEGLIGEGDRGAENENGAEQIADYQAYQTAVSDQSAVLGGEILAGNAGSGDGGNGGSERSAALSDFSNMRNPFNPPNVPIFFVEGLDNTTNYLRLYTSSSYKNGIWIPDELSCSQPSVPLFSKKFKITPILALSDYLPVSKDTKGVTPLKPGKIYECYDSDKGVFGVESTRIPYYGYSTASKVKPTVIDGRIQPYSDPEIRNLAEKITANATDDYEKVKAIEDYLKNNYINSYLGRGTDVREFLFKTKVGTAREFASAFVLLAQSLGIPSRVVFGYLADPVPENQTIFASDAYVWAEVRFKEGWVEFDPSPEGIGIETKTEITYVDSKLIAGENFTVEGRVTDSNGNPVRGYVEIFLKKDKKGEKGLLVGVTKVNGTFRAMLKAPETTGRFNVVAHYTGSLYHLESWSDPEVEIYYKPEINVTLPEKVAKNFVLKGKMETDKPYSGYIDLCVDGSCRNIKVRKGYFEAELNLSEGDHEIKLMFPGQGYLLPFSFVKKVQAGDVEVIVNESVKEGENVTGVVLFNGKPVNATILINGEVVRAVNGNFSVHLPLKLGKNELNFTVADFLYSEKKTVFSKRGVEIETQRYGEKLRVIVKDSEGNPADGFVELNGMKRRLESGVAEFDIPKNFEGGILIYSGSERYFPAVKELTPSFPIFILIPVIVAAVSAVLYYFYRVLWWEEKIKISVEKEHPELPDVWDVGERVRISLEEPAFVRVDGYSTFTDSLELSFDSHGIKKIVAEKKDGRKRKRGELEIKIMPYSDGIAEIVRKLEKIAEKRFENVESLTGREIMEKLGVKAPVLLNYFEQGKYGRREYTRKEFLEAFEDYLRVMGNEGI
ncbi:transglutaminase-like domain-containing protein [Archaeoglobus sp.]